MAKRRLNGIIFSNYLRLPLNKYIFLVKQLEKHPHLARVQFHQIAKEKGDKNTAAATRESKKSFTCTYTHRGLALQFSGNRPDLSGQVSEPRLDDKLSKRIRFINAYNLALYKILLSLIHRQKAYFKSGNTFDLKHLTQKKVALSLKINASWIHYIISAKNILTPKKKILPLRALFCSKKKWLQLRLEAILDQEIRRELFLKYGRNISLRGVCSYRHSLRVPALRLLPEGKKEKFKEIWDQASDLDFYAGLKLRQVDLEATIQGEFKGILSLLDWFDKHDKIIKLEKVSILTSEQSSGIETRLTLSIYVIE